MNVSRIYRLLRLVTLLQSGQSYTAIELAEELAVSRRTVFRDLNALELARIPYYYDSASKGFRISAHFFLPPVNLTLGESLAMLALTGRLRTQANVPLLSEASRAAAKLESILPSAIRDHVGSVIEKMHVQLGPMASHEEDSTRHFDELSGAVVAHRICQMQYDSVYDKKAIEVTIHPLRLFFMQRAWYVLAFSPKDNALRSYKLIRIRSLQVTNQNFAPPESEMVDNHFSHAWAMIPEGQIHDVRLRFLPRVARNVSEVQWHHSQRVEWNDDGSMDYYVRVDGLREIGWWVLGYGDQVKVLAPSQLAEHIAATARRTLQLYDRPSDQE